MKKFSALIAAVLSISLSAEVLWQADMNKEMGGFTVHQNINKKDTATVKNGELVLLFHKGLNKGIDIRQQIPMPERGDFSFDAVMNSGSKPGYGAWSVKMHLFGKMIAWNGSPNWGLATFTPPSKWDIISRIDNNKKVNYRIRFDRTKGTMEVYLNGSLIPVKTFTGVKFAAPQDGKGYLEIANYGYASGKLTHRISNLKLETIPAAEEVTEARTIWQERFSVDGDLSANGYVQTVNNGKDQFSVKGGVLTMICQNSPYKGSTYTKAMPGVLRGEITFEAAVGEGNGYNHYSLNLFFGDLNVAWRPNRSWQLYHPKENKWYVLTNLIGNGKWHKYKISFDAVKKIAEFYVDDMENPVFIDQKSEFLPLKETLLQIRNYGLCNGTIVNKIRNIELRVVPEKKKNKSAVLSGTILFQGASTDEWKALDFARSLGETEVSSYILQCPAHHTTNDNTPFDLQPKPGPNRGMPKNVILADIPAKPIPDYTLKMIRDAVENGARLFVLDGLFTLQKGEYAGTVLEEILPVSVKDPWKKAVPLPGASFLKHNGKNVIVYKKVGKGVVYVVMGNAVKDPSVAEILRTFKF